MGAGAAKDALSDAALDADAPRHPASTVSCRNRRSMAGLRELLIDAAIVQPYALRVRFFRAGSSDLLP
jgi:hypothetical protein